MASYFKLMNLPAELRLEIYDYVFIDFGTKYDDADTNTKISPFPHQPRRRTYHDAFGSSHKPAKVKPPPSIAIPAVIQTSRLIRTESFPMFPKALQSALDRAKAEERNLDQTIDAYERSQDVSHDGYIEALQDSILKIRRKRELTALQFRVTIEVHRFKTEERRLRREMRIWKKRRA